MIYFLRIVSYIKVKNWPEGYLTHFVFWVIRTTESGFFARNVFGRVQRQKCSKRLFEVMEDQLFSHKIRKCLAGSFFRMFFRPNSKLLLIWEKAFKSWKKSRVITICLIEVTIYLFGRKSQNTSTFRRCETEIWRVTWKFSACFPSNENATKTKAEYFSQFKS